MTIIFKLYGEGSIHPKRSQIIQFFAIYIKGFGNLYGYIYHGM
jgi:hypothetical protein